jgi:hypothetical protein
VISLEEAHRRVAKFLSQPSPYPNDPNDLVVIDESTIERPWGWIFFYDSAAHIRSGSLDDMVAGNAPVLVERESGRLFLTGTAEDTEHYIALFENGELEELELVDPRFYS